MTQRLPALLSLLALSACFNSDGRGDRCEEDAVRVCFPVDAVGCCGDSGAIEVPLCDGECPAGMIEASECRTSGCEPLCETPIACRADVGSACCGAEVFNTSCDSCPAGSIPATSCAGNFPDDCGCDGSRRGFIPPDAGRPQPADAGPVIDAGEAPAPPLCHEDLGGGCCGASTGMVEGPCGCPSGTLSIAECGAFADSIGGGGLFERCRVGTEGGCCGDFVEPNGCGLCPAGAVPESACAPDDSIDPVIVTCRIGEAGGCCGESVPGDRCGACPAGSVPETECGAVLRSADDAPMLRPAPPMDGGVPFDPDAGAADAGAPPEPPECFALDGMCTRTAINVCGECPEGSEPFCTME